MPTTLYEFEIETTWEAWCTRRFSLEKRFLADLARYCEEKGIEPPVHPWAKVREFIDPNTLIVTMALRWEGK